MSAKEMFEKLGYKDRTYENLVGKKIISYSKKINYIYCDIIGVITFDQYGFRIENYKIENGKASICHGVAFISCDLLRAINKQVEELGWLNNVENLTE